MARGSIKETELAMSDALGRAVPRKAIRLWLDDDLEERKAPEGWTHVVDVSRALLLIRTGRVVEMSLDHDLGDGGEGIEIINFLDNEEGMHGRSFWPREGITLHSANPVGRHNMARAIVASAGRIFRVRETLTRGGKKRFEFENPEEKELYYK